MASMNSHQKAFEVFSSWHLESENKDLNSTITINSLNKSVDLDDVVQLDTCVHLISKSEDNKEPCTITITIPESSTSLVSQLVIVSEARLVELFGRCGEYLNTYTGEYVDDFEGCAVYMTDCQVKPSEEVLVKFQKTKRPDSLWVYGINLTLCPKKYASPAKQLSSINFQSVNEILKDAKVPLSENAEKCKTFLQNYGGTFNITQVPLKSKALNPQVLMKMLNADYFNPLGETGKNMTKCISNLIPFMTKDIEDKSMAQSEINHNVERQSSDLLMLKSFIDQRFVEFESKVEQKLKELEMKQNEKLNCIIDLLIKLNK